MNIEINKKKVRFIPLSKDVVAFDEDFRFQPKTKKSRMGQGSIILGLKTKKGDILTSTSGETEVALPSREVFLLPLTRNLKRERGLPQTPKNDVPNTLGGNDKKVY